MPDEIRSDLQRVCEGAHMDDTKYAAVWMKELSQGKPEFALKVLGLIPQEWKQRGPGRPRSSDRLEKPQNEVEQVA